MGRFVPALFAVLRIMDREDGEKIEKRRRPRLYYYWLGLIAINTVTVWIPQVPHRGTAISIEPYRSNGHGMD
ncbi:hypothetical protein BDW71DRAFT_151941 [Aspergillus fruticulosus]